MDVEYLTVAEVVELHDRLCDLYGGAKDVLDPAVIESAVAQPRQGGFGVEYYPTLHLKAAAYCYFLVLNHGFRDGNKRAGVAAAFHFLLKNGVTPSCPQQTLYDAVLRVIDHECTLEQLAAVLESSS